MRFERYNLNFGLLVAFVCIQNIAHKLHDYF